ncbi:MAG: tetratricopeptide repeat protein, partial [Bacteroidia bacterium]|nr:tetratricopeptide repeat protein [Bacteroidia bacterium]
MKHIIICLLTLFACQSYAQDQNKPDSLKLDSLQKAFDRQQTGAEGDCIKTAINICMALYDSPGGFLIPDYAAKGLRACGGKKDTLSIQNSQTLLGILGAWYLRQGKYTDAADQYNLMRSIGGINPDQMVLARSYNGLGLANYYLRNFEKSVDYYRKALPCVGNNSTRLGKLYQNLANSFVELKEIDSALVYYYKALPSVLEENKDPAISIQYMNIALAYLKQNNPQEFIKNIEIALDYAKKAKSPYHIASIYQRMGDNFAMSGSSELSAKYYRLALEKFEEVKVYDQIAYCRIHLAMAYEKEANFKQGFEQLWELTELSDSLKRDEGTTKLQKLEADYLVMKQAQEVELKKLKADANQRILLVAISGALIILIVLLVMGFKSYRLKMKINRTKERFYSMIAHDIRSPFSGILGLAGLWNEEAEEGRNTVDL